MDGEISAPQSNYFGLQVRIPRCILIFHDKYPQWIRKPHQQCQKCLFGDEGKTKVAVKIGNNGHLAKVKLWLGHIIWPHIQAKFEDDLLYTITVIRKIC